MPNKNRRPFIVFLSGATGGACVSILIATALFYARVSQTVQVNTIPVVQATNIFQGFTAVPSPTETNSLDDAEAALDSGQPERVRELLYPMIETWSSNDDRIHGYKLLGEAELAQGHPQLAVPYFEKLYFYQPSAENLFYLATTYDTGGDIRNALAKYQDLTNWDDLPSEIDIELINMRIYDLSRALGTPMPTYTPTSPSS